MSQGYGEPGGHGGGGFGPPPGMGLPQGAMGPYRAGSARRAVFSGAGIGLFVIYILYSLVPNIGLQLVQAAINAGAHAVLGSENRNATLMVTVGLALVGFLAGLMVSLFYQHNYLKFYWENMQLEGKQCRYEGSVAGLASALAVPALLTCLTVGFYYAWAYRAYMQYVADNVDVQGERLQFDGSAVELFPMMLLGGVLSVCTLGIYIPWYMNNVYAWCWEGLSLNGRTFTFRKDGGDLLVTVLGVAALCVVTLFIYTPWGICKILNWEADHVD